MNSLRAVIADWLSAAQRIQIDDEMTGLLGEDENKDEYFSYLSESVLFRLVTSFHGHLPRFARPNG